MSDTNDELTSEYSEKLERIEAEKEYAEQMGVKFPSSFTDYLKFVKSKYNEVVKKLADKDNKEALQKKIFDLWGHVFVGELKLRLLVPFYWVCAVRESFKNHADLARLHIDNYKEHTENFLKIKRCVENDERLPEHTIDSYRRELRGFLHDFEIGEPALVAAIKKEKQAVQFQKTHIRLSRVAIVVAALSGLVAILPYVARFFEFLWELITAQTP